MCEFSGKLIAWLDRELPADAAASVERHLESCPACRSRIDEFKRVSSEFDAYCDEAIASNVPREIPRWVPAVSAAAAVASLVAVFLVLPRKRIDPPALYPSQIRAQASPVIVAEGLPTAVNPIVRVHRRQSVAPVQIQNTNADPAQSQNAYFVSNEPVIQIAIPADELFPPGAVPEGMHFAADLTIAADGSAERLRMHPRLAGFERRTTQP
jgi:anti-sigma factor RsiW